MSLSSLQVLADRRNDILLAEVGAWLHDIGKCTSEFLYIQQARAEDNLDPYKAIFEPSELGRYQFSAQRQPERMAEANVQYAFHKLVGDPILKQLDATFKVEGTDYTLREAVYFSRPRFAGNIGRALGRAGEPLDLLAYCHGEAHFEKEEPMPAVTLVEISRHSPFGFHLSVLPKPDTEWSLTKRLKQFDFSELTKRSQLVSQLRTLFNQALGDTRFPINEVTLWDWSYAVAGLYKSELARHFLTGEWRERDDLRWRLLRVNFDVLGLYAKAIKIADLLAYRQAVDEACAPVKRLVEEEYPLGNEVYRDTTGIYFTFPDRDLFPELEQEIRRRVEAIEPELAPRIVVDPSEPLKTLLSSSHNKARQELAQPMTGENVSPDWQMQWENLPEGKWELCPVCRLRPMTEKAEVCEHCKTRRGSRIQAWLNNPRETIWLDEIADHNDRVALIVGKFGLDDWLSGDLVQTMLVKAVENNPSQCVPKNPSPARLRRVWETTQRFWTETVEDILKQHHYAEKMSSAALRCVRVRLIPSHVNWQEDFPYDGTINGKTISLLWLKDKQRFVTISNLQLAATQARNEIELVTEWHGREVWVSLPDKPGQSDRFTVQGIELLTDEMQKYLPYLTLPTSPDQFLALVPASDALAIAEKIRKQYTEQFGKVQNRLPLFLGVVFFQRKLPLAAVMDTARRMLEQVNWEEDEQWIVQDKQDDLPNVKLRLSKDNQTLEYVVRVKMGDDTTDDVWYPYFFTEGNVQDRECRFEFPEKDPSKSKYAGRALVHVSDLCTGDTVRVLPSRFAYIYLEHTAQRFEFDAKDENAVMLLDEPPRLRGMWNALQQSDIKDTGLRGVQALLETKGAAWGATSQELEQLADTTLKQAKLFKRKDQDGNALPDIVKPEDVTGGRFRRCLELHTKILKLHVKEEKNEQQPETATA